MKIKIISDGSPMNTQVFAQDSTVTIEGITEIDWHLDVHGLAKATLKFINVPVDIVGDSDYEIDFRMST